MTISTNVTSAVSINSDDKKVRCKMDCYILLTFLLETILLFTSPTCKYFDNSIKIKSFEFDILYDKKSYENLLI